MPAQVECQLIAQEVEANLVSGSIGDVRRIAGAPLFGRHALLYVADAQTHAAIDIAHPAGIAARQIVVCSDDMHALVLARQPDHRRNSRQCLPFAGLHLRDTAPC